MRAGRPACHQPRCGRARDGLTRRRWRGRQVTDADADPADTPVACPAFAARLPVGGNDVPEDARVRLKEATEGLLGGRWPVFGRERDDDMAPAPDWFLDPTTGRRAEMAGQFAHASAFPGVSGEHGLARDSGLDA